MRVLQLFSVCLLDGLSLWGGCGGSRDPGYILGLLINEWLEPGGRPLAGNTAFDDVRLEGGVRSGLAFA